MQPNHPLERVLPGPLLEPTPKSAMAWSAETVTRSFARRAAAPDAANASRDIAISVLRLANLDSEIVDRLSRYEASLWRQLVQTLFALQTLKRR